MVPRGFRRIARYAATARDVARVAIRQGPLAARHRFHERSALRASQWAALRLHLAARLNLRLAGDGELRRAFSVESPLTVDRLSFELLIASERALESGLRGLAADDAGDLYAYFRYFGSFRSANLLRRVFLQACVREQLASSVVSPRALAAALELGQPDVVLGVLRQKRILRRDRRRLADIQAVAHAVGGDVAAARAIWAASFREADARFLEYLNGRSVAVVGPAPPTDEVGAEIDAHDVVVRTNFRKRSNTPTAHYGERTDVSYYNHYRMARLRDQVVEAAASLKWTILKSPGDEAAFADAFPGYAGGARSAFLAHAFFVDDAAPMAIQTILSDLIRFSPGSVKLFCTTFYNSTRAYSAGYRVIPLGSDAVAESLRIHEPFSGLAFVQHFRSAGLCTSDRLTDGVLSLTLEQYASNLDDLYGALTLPLAGQETWA